MIFTFRNRFVALATGGVLAACLPALLSASAAARPAAIADRPHAVIGQHMPWLTGNTAGRGLRWVRGGAVADAVGKIFLTLNHAEYACSGVLVRGGHTAVVLTAAHCVSSGGRFATSWTFIPGYRDGHAPYGRYTARRFYVSPRWTGPGRGDERYDVAFVRVAPRRPNASSPAPPRGLPAHFTRSQATRLPSTYVFGYPDEKPFSGQYPNFCAGPVSVVSGGTARRDSARTACGMTAGDSGGPWLAGFSPRAGTGAIVAVTAFKLSGDQRTLYGTVLGPTALALYRAAAGLPPAGRGR